MRPPGRSCLVLAGAAVLALLGMAACSSGRAATAVGPGASKLRVVAAENVWGSIAAQLGGDRVDVTSLVNGPGADPHDYEPTPGDARRVASAQYVIGNGAGYDPWLAKLLAADRRGSHVVLDVSRLVGVGAGGNPHRWYSPSDVAAVITQITADYRRLDPTHAAFYEQRNQEFTGTDLRAYHDRIAAIRARFAGTPVGASESVFVPMAAELGLDLVTPPALLEAVSEGTEPTAGDKATVDRQIATHRIKVYVYNAQNSTPDVRAQVDEARRAGIPTTTITETLVPSDTSFQSWQVAQLDALDAALAKAAGT